MNVLFVLILLFLLLTFAVFRIEGLFQVTGLFMNVAVFLALLVLIDRGAPILPAACVAFLAVAAITLFFVNGVNQKTKIAFVCVLVFLGLFLLLFPLVLSAMNLHGFSAEELDELAMYSFDVAIDFKTLMTAIILMSFSGAVADGSMAISTATYELFQANPQVSIKALSKSSMTVVSDVLSSTINTLLFAFMGSNLALIAWFQDLSISFGEMINSKAFVSELVVCLVTGLAAVIILPITAWAASWYFLKRNRME